MKRILILSNIDFLHPFINPRMMKAAITAKREGFIVDIVCYSYFTNLPKIENWNGIKIIRLRSRKNIPRDLIFISKIVKLCKDAKYSLIHVNELGSLIPGVIAKIITKSPLIYDSHELIWDMNQSWIINKLAFVKESLLLPFVNTTIHTNKYRLKEFIKAHKFMRRAKNAIVIENYAEKIDLPYSEYITKKRELRERKNIPINNLVFIYQGEIGELRKVDNVIKAFKNFRKSNKNSTLILIGSLKLPLEMVNEKGIIFLSTMAREKLFNYLTLSDIGISPLVNTCKNNYYPSSYKIYEYLSTYNIPIVADFPAIREELNGFGYYCDFNDIKSIEKSFNSVAWNMKTNTIINEQKKAYELHCEQFNFNHIKNKLISTYNLLVNKPVKLNDLYHFTLKNFGPKSLFSTLYGINYGRSSEYVQVYNALSKYNLNKSRILDIGGEGTFFPFFMANNNPLEDIFICDLLKMEVASDMLTRIKLKNVHLLPATNFFNINDKFNVILAISTIEHFSPEEFEYFIRRIKYNLNKDGILLITMPFTRNKETIEFYYENNKKQLKGRFISKNDLDRFIEQIGLKLVYKSFWGEKKFIWSKIIYHRYLKHKIRNLLFLPFVFMWDKLFISEGSIDDFPIKKHYSMIDYVMLIFKNK